MRSKQRIRQRNAQFRENCIERNTGEYSADERVAIGVWSARGEADDHVTGAKIRGGEDAVTLHHADNCPSHVKLSFGVHARHFRRLAAQQGHPRFSAGLSHPGHHIGSDFWGQLRGGKIVQEKQRTSALNEDVVNAVVDDVVPNRAITPGRGSQLDLRSDPVG